MSMLNPVHISMYILYPLLVYRNETKPDRKKRTLYTCNSRIQVINHWSVAGTNLLYKVVRCVSVCLKLKISVTAKPTRLCILEINYWSCDGFQIVSCRFKETHLMKNLGYLVGFFLNVDFEYAFQWFLSEGGITPPLPGTNRYCFIE